MWRCVKDMLGYCGGEPTGIAEATEILLPGLDGYGQYVDSLPSGMFVGATCSKVPESCGLYRNVREAYKEAGLIKG